MVAHIYFLLDACSKCPKESIQNMCTCWQLHVTNVLVLGWPSWIILCKDTCLVPTQNFCPRWRLEERRPLPGGIQLRYSEKGGACTFLCTINDDEWMTTMSSIHLHMFSKLYLACFAWQMDRLTAPISLCLRSVVPASVYKLAFFFFFFSSKVYYYCLVSLYVQA